MVSLLLVAIELAYARIDRKHLAQAQALLETPQDAPKISSIGLPSGPKPIVFSHLEPSPL